MSRLFATPNGLPAAVATIPPFVADCDPQREAERAAALRALSLQRVMAYGVELGDALLIRERVSAGMDWTQAAIAVAERALTLDGDSYSDATRRDARGRAAACLRVAQIVMESDTSDRVALITRASELMERSVDDDPRFRRVLLPHHAGDLYGWHIRPAEPSELAPTVVVFGGMEGWAEDFVGASMHLLDRGMAAFVLDGPGQGLTRMLSRHYLTTDFVSGYRAVIDYLCDQSGGRSRIGLWGNSMGGNFAVHVASQDERVSACCNNGGGAHLSKLGVRPRTFAKMHAMTGTVSEAAARAVFDATALDRSSITLTCPLLVVHGGQDPLIELDDMVSIHADAPSPDKTFHNYEDADHCVYLHPAEKHALIGDWFAQRLQA